MVIFHVSTGECLRISCMLEAGALSLLSSLGPDCSIHENEASGTAGALMLPSQVCHATSRPQVPVLAALYALAIMQGKASAAPLNLNDISFSKLHAIEVPFWLHAFLIALFQKYITCTSMNHFALLQSSIPFVLFESCTSSVGHSINYRIHKVTSIATA